MPVVRRTVGSSGGGIKSFDLDEVFERLTGNHVMRDFFSFDEKREALHFSDLIRNLVLFASENTTANGVLMEVLSMPDDEVDAGGRRILAEFSAQPVFNGKPKANSFTELSGFKTAGSYDLTQLLNGSLGNANRYPQLISEFPGNKGYEETFARLFRDGLITLRAIELECKRK